MKFKTKLNTSLLVLSSIIATACGGGGGGGGSSSANPSCVEKLDLFTEDAVAQNEANEVIIDDLRWQSTTALKDAMKRSNASASVYLSIPANRSRCSGFLISDNMVMTNNHCIGKASEAKGTTVKFGYTAKGKGESFSCGTFMGTNSKLDFTVIKCSGNPGKKYPKVTLADYPGKVNDMIYVMHQNCDYKSQSGCLPTQKYSEGMLLRSGSSRVAHNADTLGGSSGSPIFSDESDKVIAIHNSGANTSNGGGTNYGIPMYKIVEYMRSKMKSVEFTASSSRQPAYQTCGE